MTLIATVLNEHGLRAYLPGAARESVREALHVEVETNGFYDGLVLLSVGEGSPGGGNAEVDLTPDAARELAAALILAADLLMEPSA